jgi:hypothetical protein
MKHSRVIPLQLALDLSQSTTVTLLASTKLGPVKVRLDQADLDLLGGRRLSIGSHGYAQLWADSRHELLHRHLLGLKPRDGQLVDHRNGNPLDCSRSNLRLVTSEENSANRRPLGISGHLGVHAAPDGRWRVRVQTRKTTRSLGVYDDLTEAARISHAFRLANIPGYVGRGSTITPARHLTAA